MGRFFHFPNVVRYLIVISFPVPSAPVRPRRHGHRVSMSRPGAEFGNMSIP
jgi:hypothetical protein